MSTTLNITVFTKMLKQRFCKHEFSLADLHKTGIEQAPFPESGTIEDMQAWHRNEYEGEHHTKRVKWPCRKCRKVFFAHCGLEISPKHGYVTSDGKE